MLWKGEIMNIFDKHPLPWQTIEVSKGEAVVLDAVDELIAQFENLTMAR